MSMNSKGQMVAEGVPPFKLASEQYPELQALAVTIANRACRDINGLAGNCEAPGMPYKAQCTLELLISELQKRV